jgi:hypothetical protein
MVDDDHLLAARLQAVAPWEDDSDWEDVRARAMRLGRSRTWSRERLVVLIAAAAFLAVAAPAIAFRHELVRLFSTSAPAPVPVKRSFAELDHGAPPGMAPHVEAGLARVVLRRPLGHDKTAITWAAPTRQGGFCTETAIATQTRPHPTSGGGGCDRDRFLRLAPQSMFLAPLHRGAAIHGPMLFSGDTLIHGAASIELTYQDGTYTSIPLTWISKPINAAFFAYLVPPNHTRPGHRPTTIRVIDHNGQTLLIDDTFFGPSLFAPPPAATHARSRRLGRSARPPA